MPVGETSELPSTTAKLAVSVTLVVGETGLADAWDADLAADLQHGRALGVAGVGVGTCGRQAKNRHSDGDECCEHHAQRPAAGA